MQVVQELSSGLVKFLLLVNILRINKLLLLCPNINNNNKNRVIYNVLVNNKNFHLFIRAQNEVSDMSS
jgi:hypothetical protein